MRVCILGSPRSGTTSLYKYLTNSLELEGLNEPYNKRMDQRFGKRNLTEYDIWERDNLVVKHLSMQLDRNQISLLEDHFDKIVLIYREDVKSASESWLCGNYSGNWDKKYNYNDIIYRYDEEEAKFLLETDMKERYKDIEFYKTLPFFTVTYENLFYSDKDKIRLKEYFNITDNKFDFYFDIKNKLRQEKSLPKTII